MYIIIALFVLLVAIISVYPTGAFIVGWATCPYRYSQDSESKSICFTIATSEDTTGVDIILRETGGKEMTYSKLFIITANNNKQLQVN